jgi:predicted DNA repair protein MutK
MAGASLLTLLDDIALVLDDVALMTKVAAKKTAGVLGDDLALNAQQVSGVNAARELPVVWAVAKGSFRNKLILVPAALAISAFIPWLITPLLMLGGAYLCFEGFEKLAHKYFHKQELDIDHDSKMAALADHKVDMVAFEEGKIKGAIRTDFILSAEIIVIALGTVEAASFVLQAAVVSTIALVMTVGVYTLVAGIVKLDDAGFYLLKKPGKIAQNIGKTLVAAAPKLMKTLTIVGTAAMFMVGGGILIHGIPGSHALIHHCAEWVTAVPFIGAAIAWSTPSLIGALTGLIAGALLLAVAQLYKKLSSKVATSE